MLNFHFKYFFYSALKVYIMLLYKQSSAKYRYVDFTKNTIFNALIIRTIKFILIVYIIEIEIYACFDNFMYISA